VQGPLPELQRFVENGYNALFADGSVRFISKSINSTLMKALITRDAGEPTSMPD
jgi:prepilin-type processing-associated H-X9-DG protein